MSYQVLARKWRPRRFREMVGQEHVLKALVNALDDDRLHHAYLFTGTRGVGKTSIARLFAKSLNCERGISSEPCGECTACREIAEGRFVDLIEVDAASRTKVEDTRELLENVQYLPTHGRFKVYLIDEVHMLSTSSFNALLKTLEEPPEHVKFLLATTDPQKLPVTVLSRCLQFNLKNLIPERIVAHLRHVLQEEGIGFEDPALWLLARSADGSMRDALSLTDQAIAFGAGAISESDVRAMLGTIDQRLVYRMLDAIAAQDGAAVLAASAELAEFSPDYGSVLGDLISLLHRIALAQAVPDAVDNSLGDLEQVRALAARMRAEDVQLYYQVAVMGRKDLPYVPHAREGLEMTLLRMLAFRPAAAQVSQRPESGGAVVEKPAAAAEPERRQEARQVAAAPAAEAPKPEPPAAVANVEAPVRRQPPAESVPPMDDEPPPWDDYDALPEMTREEPSAPLKKPEAPSVAAPGRRESPAPEPRMSAASALAQPVAPSPEAVASPPEPVAGGGLDVAGRSVVAQEPPAASVESLAELEPGHWVLLVDRLGLSGMTESLARALSLESCDGGQLRFHFTPEQEALFNETQRGRIKQALEQLFGTALQVDYVKAAQTRETPAQYMARKRAERQAQAVAAMRNDPLVQQIMAQFDAQIDEASVLPIDS